MKSDVIEYKWMIFSSFDEYSDHLALFGNVENVFDDYIMK